MLSEVVVVQERGVSSGFGGIMVEDISDFLAEDAVVHVSVRLINYNYTTFT